MKAALCEALADLESYCPREFSLMLIEAEGNQVVLQIGAGMAEELLMSLKTMR